MNNLFNIDCGWLSAEGNDTDAIAELTITIDEHCATRLEDVFAKAVRNSAKLSALRLAQWLASNWWRLLWEPKGSDVPWRLSHHIGAAGGGYIWPDVTFASDWRAMTISSRHTRETEFEPIRYLNDFDYYVSLANFSRGATVFIEGTIARLKTTGDPNNRLGELWDEIAEEIADESLSEFRKLEAVMGYDPDEAPEAMLMGLIECKSAYGSDAVEEISTMPEVRTAGDIEELWKTVSGRGIAARVPNCEELCRSNNGANGGHAVPWMRAEATANRVHEVWGTSAPVSSKQLTDLFALTEKEFLGATLEGLRPAAVGVRDSGKPGHFLFSCSGSHLASRRFALMRMVGDHIAAGEDDRLLPGTRSVTDRQQFQRAFAQAFLCPADAVRERLGRGVPSDEEISDAAEHFGVSPLTIRNVLVNKGIVEREALDIRGA